MGGPHVAPCHQAHPRADGPVWHPAECSALTSFPYFRQPSSRLRVREITRPTTGDRHLSVSADRGAAGGNLAGP